MIRLVVGAVLVDGTVDQPRVLAARRVDADPADGGWEFPGGKVEDGESPQAALARELREELRIAVRVGAAIDGPDGGWPISDTLTLRLFLVETSDDPSPGPDHDDVRWVAADALDSVAWTPVDRAALPAVVDALRARRVDSGVSVNGW